LIEIRMKGCRLFLEEKELLDLLAKDKPLWAAAIRRRQAGARGAKAPARCREP